MKVLVGILVVIIAALIWSLYTLNDTRRQMTAQQQSNEVVVLDFSNRWETSRRSLDEQRKVNETLETNLQDRARQLETLRVDIANLTADLARSRAETKTAQEEIAKRETQITSLENRNVDLTRQMGDLQTAIEGLEEQITAAERKLAASEGNRQELLAELKRLQDEKLSMEKQLNDLAFLRDQVRKLKDELNVARRLDWIRRGIYGQPARKGAESLADRKLAPRPPVPVETAGDTPGLDVELRRSGEVKVLPSRTNEAVAPR